jgi:5-methylcytosine-specific restriction protein A
MPYLKKPERIKQTSIKREERNEVYTSTRWRKLRLSYLQGLLQSLRFEKGKLVKEDKVVPAVDVHHIISFMTTNDPLKRKWLAFDSSNLMSLCKECHQKIHNK